MGKIEQLYLETSKEALQNSRLWLEEANHLLFERRSYGHAVSLMLFSIEEAVKSWICFFVGIGSVDHTEDLVKEVFESHHSKFGSAIFFWMFVNIPIFQKSISEELSEEEEALLKGLMTTIDPHYQTDVKRLVNLRNRGIYVDNPEGKILSPRTITREEAEGIFIDAINFNKFVEMALNRYKNADDEERKKLLNLAKKSAQIGLENWNRIAHVSE